MVMPVLEVVCRCVEDNLRGIDCQSGLLGRKGRDCAQIQLSKQTDDPNASRKSAARLATGKSHASGAPCWSGDGLESRQTVIILHRIALEAPFVGILPWQLPTSNIQRAGDAGGDCSLAPAFTAFAELGFAKFGVAAKLE